jgi:hypothetical protein
MLLVHASFATMGLGMMLWPVRSSLISLAAGVAVATGFVVFGAHPDEAYLALLDRAGIYSVLVVAAALPYLLVVLVRPARRGSPWSLAFALLAAAVLGLRLVTLPDVPPAAVGAGLAQALALAVICVPLAALARQALRRLSPVRVDSGQGSLG